MDLRESLEAVKPHSFPESAILVQLGLIFMWALHGSVLLLNSPNLQLIPVLTPSSLLMLQLLIAWFKIVGSVWDVSLRCRKAVQLNKVVRFLEGGWR